ncbi:MAG: AI-2E family transporter [Acidimicrobiia bacterium]|nr:AI-2E family transporter [Acidimicrobiia bacterium]
MVGETSQRKVQRFAALVWSIIGVAIIGWLLIRIASSVQIIWLPLAFAAGLVFLLNPIVNYLEARRVPRVVAVFLSFLFFVTVVVAGFSLLVPAISEQSAAFASSLPETYDALLEWVEDIGQRFNLDIGVPLTEAGIRDWLSDPANQETIQQVIGNFGTLGGRLILGVAEGVAVVVLAPLMALYMLLDLKRTKEKAVELTPPRHREEAVFVASQVATAMGSFVRGQLLVAIIVGVASSIGLWILDIPFWLIIGILSGILNLIPFAGPIVGGALAALVALLDGSVAKAVLAILIFTAIQQTDNHVITPLVQRTRVQLSPLVIVLALIVGGSLAGLLGVLVAVPLTAAVRIIAGHLWRTRILGQSWAEASSGMIERTPPPERLAGLRRRNVAGQQKLFDTAERPLDDVPT